MSDAVGTPTTSPEQRPAAAAPVPFEKPIYVTRPFLPPIEEFTTGR